VIVTRLQRRIACLEAILATVSRTAFAHCRPISCVL